MPIASSIRNARAIAQCVFDKVEYPVPRTSLCSHGNYAGTCLRHAAYTRTACTYARVRYCSPPLERYNIVLLRISLWRLGYMQRSRCPLHVDMATSREVHVLNVTKHSASSYILSVRLYAKQKGRASPETSSP